MRPDAFIAESFMLLYQIGCNFLKVMLAVNGYTRKPGYLIITHIQLLANVWNIVRIKIADDVICDDFWVFTRVHDYLKGNSSPSVSGKSMKPFSEAVLAKLAVLVLKSPL